MLRLASQVSWAASMSRFRGVAAIVMAKPFCELARDLALQPAEMVDIGDDAVADIAGNRRDQGDAAGRHVDDLAGEFAAIRQHVAAQQVDADALMAPAFLGVRQRVRFGLRQAPCGGDPGDQFRSRLFTHR